MSILEKPFYHIGEVCARWNMGEHDLAAFVLAGELTLSATVAGVRVIHGIVEEVDINQWEKIPEGHRYIIGTIDIMRDDAWTVLREGCHGITHLKVPEDEYIAIDDYRWSNGYTVCRDDLVICRAEIDRFEAAHLGLAAMVGKDGRGNREAGIADGSDDARNRPRTGAPVKYDWDGFWVEVCRRIYEDGVPATQGELVRLMQDWFGKSGRHMPDVSTLKKKVSPLWRQIAPRGSDSTLEGGERRRV
ncbi:hypothetical protein [Aquamicrobium terrae]|uniref:Uncharacterized protein n=1 Tax=Aquamicrobium terrae TaxID=1324945 RepID=A0ABV2MYC5_9HYPH